MIREHLKKLIYLIIFEHTIYLECDAFSKQAFKAKQYLHQGHLPSFGLEIIYQVHVLCLFGAFGERGNYTIGFVTIISIKSHFK